MSKFFINELDPAHGGGEESSSSSSESSRETSSSITSSGSSQEQSGEKSGEHKTKPTEDGLSAISLVLIVVFVLACVGVLAYFVVARTQNAKIDDNHD